MARILQLTTPYMHGEDVRRLQRALNSNRFGDFLVGSTAHGDFGPITAQGVYPAKYWLGYAKPNRRAGQLLINYLRNVTPLTADTSAPYEATWDASEASAGPRTIQATCFDAAGTTASASRQVFSTSALPVDTTAPVTRASIDRTAGPKSWCLSVPLVSLTSSEVATIRYQWDGTTGAWITYDGAISAP